MSRDFGQTSVLIWACDLLHQWDQHRVGVQGFLISSESECSLWKSSTMSRKQREIRNRSEQAVNLRKFSGVSFDPWNSFSSTLSWKNPTLVGHACLLFNYSLQAVLHGRNLCKVYNVDGGVQHYSCCMVTFLSGVLWWWVIEHQKACKRWKCIAAEGFKDGIEEDKTFPLFYFCQPGKEIAQKWTNPYLYSFQAFVQICGVAIGKNQEREIVTRMDNLVWYFYAFVMILSKNAQERKSSFSVSFGLLGWRINWPQMNLNPQMKREQKLEMLGSIVLGLASPRKILGKNFFDHSG